MSGFVFNKDSQCVIMISTTTLVNLMSMIAATVSSSALNSVGPKQTPRLETVIRFLSDFSTTLARWESRISSILWFGDGSCCTSRWIWERKLINILFHSKLGFLMVNANEKK